MENTKITEKKSFTHFLLGVLIFVAITGFTVTYVSESISYDEEEKTTLKMGYQVQNLVGDELTTFFAWSPKTEYLIYLKGDEKFSDEKISVLKDAIFSQEKVEIPNKLLHTAPSGYTTMYKGWVLAIEENSVRENVEESIELTENEPLADVVIELVTHRHPEGYAGWTNNIVDPTTQEIVKSHVTIYNFDNLSKAEIEKITRHEFGHVAGLKHSTDPEDLMYPVIQTNFPYISPCDIQALQAVELGNNAAGIICE